MFGRKWQLVTQVMGMMTFAFLAVYGLIALIENGVAVWAQEPEVTEEVKAPSLESSAASVPQIMNYQGYAKDPEGNPLNGSHTMTFRIYPDVVGGNALWEEQLQNVTVRGGDFSVLLGDSTPLPETLFDEPDRFIGVTLDPYHEMVPRQRFASVPFAMEANHAAQVDYANQAGQAGVADRAFGLNASDGAPQDVLIADAEGNIAISGQVNMGGHKITHVGTPIDGGDVATKAYVDSLEPSSSNSGGRGPQKYTVILGLQNSTYCPDGYQIKEISDLAGPDGWLYIYISPFGVFMGGLNTPNSTHEHLYAKVSQSYADYICWKTFESSAQAYTAVFLSYNQNYSCPAGYHYIPRTEVEGSNNWGHIEMNEGGVYMGGLESWAHTSQTYENGWQARWWTSHINSICFKVMGIDGERDERADRKSTRLNSSHSTRSRMPSSA